MTLPKGNGVPRPRAIGELPKPYLKTLESLSTPPPPQGSKVKETVGKDQSMMPKKMPIKILRETSIFSFVSSTKMEVSLKLVLRLPPSVEIYTHYTDGYLSEVRVTDFQGRRVVMIPRNEFGEDFSERSRKELRARLNVPDYMESKVLDRMLPLPISLGELMNESSEDIYIEIEICYTITYKAKTGIFSQSIIFRHQFYGQEPTLYLTINVPAKYEFQTKNFSIENVPMEKLSVSSEEKSEDKEEDRSIVKPEMISVGKHGIHARIDQKIRPSPPNAAVVEWQIGAPSIIKWWAILGGMLGLGSLIIAPIIFINSHFSAFSFIGTFLGGIVALMTGLNVFLFHDIELMQRWNIFYIIVIFLIIGMLIVFGYVYYTMPAVSNPNPHP